MVYEQRYKFIRDERSLSMNSFINDSGQLPLNIIYAFDDVSEKVSILNKLITDCIDSHAPIRKVKLTRPPAPWMKDLRISHLQQKRNQLRKNCTEGNLQELKIVRNGLKHSCTLIGEKKSGDNQVGKNSSRGKFSHLRIF